MDLELLVSVEVTAATVTLIACLFLYVLKWRYPSETPLASFDIWQVGLERRWPRCTPALLVATILMTAAILYCWPRWLDEALGPSYAALANNPFNPPQNHLFPHRILTPLISYLFGLRGEGIMVTNLIIAFALILLVYAHLRKNTGNSGTALMGAAIIAFSLPTLNTFFNSAYCDSLTYVLLLLQWMYRRKALVFYLMFFLCLLNRESAMFLLPWMLYLRWLESESPLWPRLRELLLGFGLTVMLYVVFRLWMASHHNVGFSTEYYLSPLLENPAVWIRRSSHKWIGLFSVFKVMWLVPLVAGYYMWRERARRQTISMLLLLACTLSQFLVAFDSSRLMTQGFLVMIMSFEYLALKHRLALVKLLRPALILNLMLPQIYTAGHSVVYMYPWIASAMTKSGIFPAG